VGVEVVKAICHSVDAHLIINMDRRPLGNDRVAVQIAKPLRAIDVTIRNWTFFEHVKKCRLAFVAAQGK